MVPTQGAARRPWEGRPISQPTSLVKTRPSAGRPSRGQREQRLEELMEASLDCFLQNGYEATTIDQIAGDLGMSKRTVYTLFEDKAALFKAVVLRAIERYTIPSEELAQAVTADLRESLIAIALKRITSLSTPDSIKLQRILHAQAYRFPELIEASFERGPSKTVTMIADLLRRHAQTGEIDVADPDGTAAIFMSVVIGIPMRQMIRGGAPGKSEIEAQTIATIDLFFNGIAAR